MNGVQLSDQLDFYVCTRFTSYNTRLTFSPALLYYNYKYDTILILTDFLLFYFNNEINKSLEPYNAI